MGNGTSSATEGMGCGSSVHSKDVPAAEGRPEKPVKKTTEPHVNTASAECKQDPFMVSTEELQQRRQRSKSEIRLVEVFWAFFFFFFVFLHGAVCRAWSV